MLRGRGRGARAGGGGARRVAARDLEEAGRPAGSGGRRLAGGGGDPWLRVPGARRLRWLGSAEAATAPLRTWRVSGVQAIDAWKPLAALRISSQAKPWNCPIGINWN